MALHKSLGEIAMPSTDRPQHIPMNTRRWKVRLRQEGSQEVRLSLLFDKNQRTIQACVQIIQKKYHKTLRSNKLERRSKSYIIAFAITNSTLNHSFFPDISVVPLQVNLVYSEALPATSLILGQS